MLPILTPTAGLKIPAWKICTRLSKLYYESLWEMIVVRWKLGCKHFWLPLEAAAVSFYSSSVRSNGASKYASTSRGWSFRPFGSIQGVA